MDGNEIAKKYIDGEHICREERQYALFLYMIFIKAKNGEELSKDESDVVKACLGIEANKQFKINQVFYEAALMRDAFEDDRQKNDNKNKKNTYHPDYNVKCRYGVSEKSFNEELLTGLFDENKGFEFAEDIYKKNIDKKNIEEIFKKIPRYYNLKNLTGFDSPNKIIHIARHNAEADLIKCDDDFSYFVLLEAHNMMNAKPDIMVIYETDKTDKQETYYKCLECKYTSEEENNINYKQTRTQCNILRFLFSADKNKIDVNIIRFVDDEKSPRPKNDNDGNLVETQISLSVLIKQYCKKKNSI